MGPYDLRDAENANGIAEFDYKMESTVKRKICQNVDAAYKNQGFPYH